MPSSTTVLGHNLFEIPVIDNHKAGVKKHEKHLERMIADLIHVLHSESGMREYRWYRSHQNPDNFFLFMTWDTEEAFRARVNTPHVQKAEADFVSKGILIKEAPESYWQYIKP